MAEEAEQERISQEGFHNLQDMLMEVGIGATCNSDCKEKKYITYFS
jgi:hypothetical protein